MTSMELMQCLGQVKSSYILDAKAPVPKANSARKRKRVWLIAAVLILLLVLAGCAAVYVVTLQDFHIGTFHWVNAPDGRVLPFENTVPFEQSRDILSLQGTAETPNAGAAAEWGAYVGSYDPDEALMIANNQNESGLPENYFQTYHCYTWEMKERLDELMLKYDLKLLGEPFYFEASDNGLLLSYAKIESLLNPGTGAEATYLDGTLYPQGTFSQSVLLTTNSGLRTNLEYLYSDRQYFLPYHTTVEDIHSYQQWEYTTSEGVKLLLALGKEKAMLICQQPEAVITVSAYFFTEAEALDKAQLEELAELLNFQPKPRSLSSADSETIRQMQQDKAAQRQLQYQAEVDRLAAMTESARYEETVSGMLRGGPNLNTGYTFLDINSDGQEELLIGMDGYIMSILVNGSPVMLYQPCYLSTGDTIVEVNYEYWEDTPTWETFRFQRFFGNEPECFMSIRRDNTGWYRSEGTATAFTPIEEEEYNRILDSYPRIPVDMVSLRSFPLPEPAEYDPDILERRYQGNTDTLKDIAAYGRRIFEERYPSVTPVPILYAQQDLSGDGQEELLLRNEYGTYVLYGVVSGGARGILIGDSIVPCQQGMIRCRSYFTENCQSWYFYRLNDGVLTQVDYLRYDADRSPENPWLHSTDGTGQDCAMVRVSETEFNRIMNFYQPLELDMISLSEYPLD